MNTMKIYLILVVNMVFWGFNISFVKIIVDRVPPVTATSFRLFIAAVTVFLILGLTRRVRFPHKNEWGYMFGGSLTSIVSHHFFLSIGLTQTSAMNAGLILGMGPLITVLLSFVFFKKKPTLITALGFILGSAGVSLTVLFGSGKLQGINLGDFEVFLSIFVQAFGFILINKAAKTMDSVLLTAYMLLIASIFLFFVSLRMEPTGFTAFVKGFPSIWVIFFLSAVLSTGLGQMIYNYAIGQVGAATASIFLNLNTLFSVIGAALFLQEAIKAAHFIGFVLIVTGVIMGSGTLETFIRQQRKKKVQLPQSVKASNH
ncbi:DMT family transporter [Bacillus benzoevorans]|uniref:Drug/metabolite transporter (DMT)-like permease n=2 Tax=Bacillus benzoevorans TaxID=1456 RepID=A0A7X0HVJ3_9BACI|nr:DMT family transporter [Bacillus benzoevorans]MBB6446405.1 drug/metabolite transporter (DMT)-like permease [Bacillus benzoevorans]